MKVAQMEMTTVTTNRLTELYQLMIENKDEIHAEKIVDLFEKKEKNEFNISFAGHFSAGKSSMINYLLGIDVLPKSPIPTSANIVKITSGEGVARVFFTDETPVEYDEPYDIDMIKDYATEKDSIRRIEISTSEAVLPSNCALLDTPGIDAADDADRLMTESSLHVVDVLYYVMDYNHVQSEVNLYFLQKIQAEQIPFYIIINQVDKHNESEIPFVQFDKNVKQTFDQWNIYPEKIYYSSVINESAAHNEIKMIKTDLFNILQTNTNINDRIFAATKEIIESHKKVIKEEYNEAIEANTTEEMTSEDVKRYEEINAQLQKLNSFVNNLKNEFDFELNQTLKNAYLMPPKLREQAKGFLESQQNDFKVGFFNTKKKTEEEKQTRLDAFLSEIQQTIEVAIQWKLKEKFIEILRENDIYDEALLQSVQQLHVEYDANRLFSFMKQGATINGNYILNYTNDISNDIKNSFRQHTTRFWQEIKSFTEKLVLSEKDKLKSEKASFESLHEIVKQQSNIKQQLQEKLEFIDDCFENSQNEEVDLAVIHNVIKKRNIVTKERVPSLSVEKEANVIKKDVVEEAEESNVSSHTMENIIETIEQVTNEIITVDGFSSIVQDLASKKDRLNNRELTIALFGAFSAGKSSFSNALFGEQILPVSPNPTTAVISRISPVTSEYHHGTVIITLKDDETLTNDLKTITKDFEPKENDFNHMIDWIKENNIHENDGLNKTYQSYLLAVLNGYEERKNKLGKTVEITLEEFPAFVTDEAKACYIETVDLYYDCALTQKGITLVDTPGADSVNARHTNVAFDYIKEADAIIYVTYYNHAITSADRDFLVQLGRVKEAFELDKMFFVVNASDLAESKADLKLVLDYVEEQLLQFGVRHPKIFPVSSKLSLEEKMSHQTLNNEMTAFETDFYSFIEEDLAALTVQAAIWDINRAKTTLHNFIETANLSQSERTKHVEQLNNRRESIKEIVNNTNDTISEKRMLERIERQLHYVLERLFIRFHDMFTDHFNPTTIKSSGRQATTELERNRNQFIDYVGYELLQEVRAVSLRVESYINELLKNMYEDIQQEIMKIDETFMLPSFNVSELQTPHYDQAFLTINMDVFSNTLKLFKNTKTFFEQNEREKMKESFYEVLRPFAKEYLDGQKQTMDKVYLKQWQTELSELKNRLNNETDSIIDQNIKVLTDTINIGALKEKHKTITKMLEHIHEG